MLDSLSHFNPSLLNCLHVLSHNTFSIMSLFPLFLLLLPNSTFPALISSSFSSSSSSPSFSSLFLSLECPCSRLRKIQVHPCLMTHTFRSSLKSFIRSYAISCLDIFCCSSLRLFLYTNCIVVLQYCDGIENSLRVGYVL